MSISEEIEFIYSSNDEVGHHKARKESMNFFTRLVEDLTDSQATYVIYVEGAECLYFWLINYDEVLRVNIFGDSLQACTRDIVEQTQAFISRNDK